MTNYEHSLICLEILRIASDTYKFRCGDGVFRPEVDTTDCARSIVSSAEIYKRFILS